MPLDTYSSLNFPQFVLQSIRIGVRWYVAVRVLCSTSGNSAYFSIVYRDLIRYIQSSAVSNRQDIR